MSATALASLVLLCLGLCLPTSYGSDEPCDGMGNGMGNGGSSIDLSIDSGSTFDSSLGTMVKQVMTDALYLELLSEQQQHTQGRARTVFMLNNPKRVSGNTFRFHFDLDDIQESIRYWQETQVYYLCKSKQCYETERIEMTSVSRQYSPKSGKFNVHLVGSASSTTTLAPQEDEDEDEDEGEEGEPQQVESFEFADEAGTTTEGDSNNSNGDSDNYDESKDLIVIEITSIIILIIVCGVGYAMFRCVVDRRDAQRELKILMSPTGLALLENEMKNENGQKSNKMSTNAKTLNQAFELGTDGSMQYKLIHASKPQ